tara:strand:+ start:25803 stop:27236 length:1434 start_codon:yes stop_codon:yes gene_type:complete
MNEFEPVTNDAHSTQKSRHTLSRSHLLAIVFALNGVFLASGALGAFSTWQMGQPAQIALVMLLVAATLWISEAVPLFVTSFVILLLGLLWLAPVMQQSGESISNTDLLAPFFSDIIVLFLGGFVLSAALHKYRLDEKLARLIIAKTGHSIPLLLIGIMAVTAFLSMWLSNTATAAMMLALCLPIVHRFPQDDRYRKAVLLSVPFAANVGGLGTPIGSPPNAIAMQYMSQGGFAPSFATWMLIGVPGVVVTLIVTWCVLMAFCRGKQQSIVQDAQPLAIKMTPSVLTVVATALLTIIGWVTGGLHNASPGTIAILPVVVLFGTKILTISDLRSISWDVLLMMGGGLCLGKAIALSGLATWFVARLPVDQSGCLMLLLIVAPVACLMSSVMSNTATANLLMPIILGLSVEHLSPLLMGVAFACTLAMPLPVSTPPNAIAFSSGELTVKDMLAPGAIITMIGLALALTIGHWFWDLVGLF